jgi:hypothetical protein
MRRLACRKAAELAGALQYNSAAQGVVEQQFPCMMRLCCKQCRACSSSWMFDMFDTLPKLMLARRLM